MRQMRKGTYFMLGMAENQTIDGFTNVQSSVYFKKMTKI